MAARAMAYRCARGWVGPLRWRDASPRRPRCHVKVGPHPARASRPIHLDAIGRQRFTSACAIVNRIVLFLCFYSPVAAIFEGPSYSDDGRPSNKVAAMAFARACRDRRRSRATRFTAAASMLRSHASGLAHRVRPTANPGKSASRALGQACQLRRGIHPSTKDTAAGTSRSANSVHALPLRIVSARARSSGSQL
jgi:hypothetical protein